MLVTNERVKELGTIPFGKPKVFTYTLTNNSGTVKLLRIAKSCNSCTTAVFDKSQLAAGESVTVTVTFTPGSTGFNAKTITLIYTDNGKPSNIGLEFKAKVNG